MTNTKTFPDRVRDAALVLLAGTFSVAALAKGTGGSQEGVISGIPFYLVVLVEVLIVVGLAVQLLRRWAMRLVMAFSIAALTFALIHQPPRCGCFGRMATLGWRGQAVVACAMAMLSSYWLAGRSGVAHGGGRKAPVPGSLPNQSTVNPDHASG